jgi:hypothetical protein
MPSLRHEAVLHLFRERPVLAAELLRGALGVELPPHRGARLVESTLTQVVPTEYHADLAILLGDPDPVLAVIVEVQLAIDTRKKLTWPLYAVALRARLSLPVCVLVVADSPKVAAWAAEPIVLGPGSTWAPSVLAPDAVPVVTDPAVARHAPELAVLSALAHGRQEIGLAVALAALAAVAADVDLDRDRSVLYHDLVVTALSPAARRDLEAMMQLGKYKYEFQSEFARRYLAEGEARGEARGRAEALLSMFAARGWPVPADQRAEILTCQDLATLDRWISQAVVASSVDEALA